MIKAENLIKSYGNLDVLKGIDLEIRKQEIVSIVGASGAGKTTLLNILGTIEKPDTGQLFINNTDIFSLKQKDLAQFRNEQIGFVFQFHHLLPEFTALENICMPAFIQGKSKKQIQDQAMELMAFLNIHERHHHKPAELSGGEQQRVAIARALINKPKVIFADEPSGNLDSKHAEELNQLFLDLRDKFNITFVIVTHNDQLANIANRVLKMQDGLFLE